MAVHSSILCSFIVVLITLDYFQGKIHDSIPYAFGDDYNIFTLYDNYKLDDTVYNGN
jgi:hypothetical protein